MTARWLSRPNSQATIMNPILPETASTETPERFQFRIRDLLVIMVLVGLFAAAIGQQSFALFFMFVCVCAVCLYFVWRKVSLSAALATIGVSGLLLMCLCAGYDESHGTAGRRISCGNNLKQIVLALHNYHDVYDSLPPTYVADKNGKPMHSWRVLILPYMEQKALYDQYRFDEPWDGPNNSKLAGQIKRAFSCPSEPHKPGSAASLETDYVAIVGDHTAWQGEKALDFTAFKDGTANTIFIVEVHNSGIHWMEPRDLHVSQMATVINAKHGQGIGSPHPHGAQVGMADCAIKFLSDDTPADVLQELITIDDGKGTLPQ
jgi:hypothetical protein